MWIVRRSSVVKVGLKKDNYSDVQIIIFESVLISIMFRILQKRLCYKFDHHPLTEVGI